MQMQNDFDLTQETKILILSNRKESLTAQAVLKALNFDADEMTSSYELIHPLNKMPAKKVMILNEKHLDDEDKFEAVFGGIKSLKDDAIVLVDTFASEHQALVAEYITTKHYAFTELKSDPKQAATIYHTKATEAFKEGLVIGEAVNFTKDLVNRPYNVLNAEKLANIAKTLDAIDGVTVNVLEKADCEAMKMGAFLGVNKGSTDAPKLIHITYKGNPNNDDMTALVGKGVMYDTGGYSLKGVTSMPNMKMDMGGSATVLGALKAIATLKLPVNVSVVVAATDNRIGDNAIVPDDVLVAADGTTIEIISTDAEGRLTLADAVWFAQKEGATKIVDVATLTGAVVAALGDAYVGAFTNNQSFYETVEKASKASKEHVWQMPVDKAHDKLIESNVADIKNSGGRLAGSSTAAAFIKHFINKDVPWVHLDIAGTAYKSESGATGVMVKTLTNLFRI